MDTKTVEPQLYRMNDEGAHEHFQRLLGPASDIEIIDTFDEIVEDLFKIDFPYILPNSPEYRKTLGSYQDYYVRGKSPEECGVWVYYPWSRYAVHLPEPDDYYRLRTARNKYLIRADEQDQFYNARVGISGLSVGFAVVNSLVLSGGAGELRIADHDTLAVPNLNRLSASVCDLGRKKSTIAARRIYEMNPFQKLRVYDDGLTSDNLEGFLSDGGVLDLYIEEVDSIYIKIASRFKARELGIPVVMATDNGDNAYVDVERFDLEPTRPLFHGLVKEETLHSVTENITQVQKIQLASAIVGSDITPRTQFSLTQVGVTLPSWPQLGNAAAVSGAAVSYVARRILTGQDMPSGRYEISLDASLDPAYHQPEAVSERGQRKQEFEHCLALLFGNE